MRLSLTRECYNHGPGVINGGAVAGRVTQKATENGKDPSGEFRFTRVYVKEKGMWVSAATLITPIAK